MLPVGHPYLYELVNDDDIPKLFTRAEKIGIACGDVSDGFEAIDFDAKNGEPIRKVFNKYVKNPEVKDIISRYNLPIIKSPSGGYHIYYRHSEKGKGPQPLASWASGKIMIETRGNGSYIATIPSEGYTQLSGSDLLKIARIENHERETLLAIAESFSEKVITKSEPTTNGKWPDKFDTTTVWGKYNEECADEMKDLLVEHGWQYIDTRKRDGVEYWQRPGKNERMPVTGATFGKCHNMFYCWTDSADGFEQRTAYTPLDIFILYEHNGNKEEAIRSLEDRFNIKHYKPTPIKTIPDQPIISTGFPIEVFPDPIQQFIRLLNESLNYSPDFLSVAMMFVIATLNGNKYKLKIKNGWNAPTVFWFAVVGEPGTMKSHPVGTIIEPIENIDREVKLSYDAEYLDYEKEVAEAKKKTLIRKPKFKQIRVTDITLESLHDVHSINKRGLGYYKDELVGFINSMNQYHKGGDEQFWLESFNNKSYIVNRVSKQVNLIEDTMINIIGTIQPSVLSNMSKDHGENGLLDRFLYTSAEEKIYPLSERDIDPGWLKWWNESIRAANKIFEYFDKRDTIILPLGEGALRKMIEIDERVCKTQASDDISDAFKNYLSKSKTYLPRITLLLSLFDAIFNNTPIAVTVDHVERANKVMQYFVNSSRTIFTKADKVKEINNVVSVKKGMTKAETIMFLHDKGYINADIAKKIDVSKVYVGQIIAKNTQNTPPKVK